jgi:hypothetical protein
MHSESIRNWKRRIAVGVIAVITGAGLAAPLPAAATPSCSGSACLVSYDGPLGFGLTAADASFVSTAIGIPILTPGIVTLAEGILEPSALDFDPETDVTPFPPFRRRGFGFNQVQWSWTIRNVSSEDLLGNAYYMFTSIPPIFTDEDGNTVDYTGTDISMTLDASLDPWVIVEAFDSSNQSFFYPAVDLGSLVSGGDADSFSMQLLIDGPLVQTGPSKFVLPQLNVGMGFTPIPEPGAAAMFAIGLAGLGVAGRRRA